MVCHEIIVRIWRAARQSIGNIKEADVRDALERLDPRWDELFPAEQGRIVPLLVERASMSARKAPTSGYELRD
jgi:site-specific DNA recombinase